MEIQYELQPEDEPDIALPLLQNVVNDHIYASSEPTLMTLSHSKVNMQDIENENITDTESSAAIYIYRLTITKEINMLYCVCTLFIIK